MDSSWLMQVIQPYLRVGPESLSLVLIVAMVIVMAVVLPAMRQHRFGWLLWLVWLGTNAWLLSTGPVVDAQTAAGTWRGYSLMCSLAAGCVLAMRMSSLPPHLAIGSK